MAEGVLSFPAIIKMNGTALAKLLDLTPPELGVGEVKETHTDVADMAHRYAPGLIEGGECSVTFLYGKAQQTTLMAALRQSKTWGIVFSDASTFTFSGFISKLGLTTEMEDEDMKTPVTIKVSGLPAFA